MQREGGQCGRKGGQGGGRGGEERGTASVVFNWNVCLKC